MATVGMVWAAAAAFLGSHLLLSHPLRQPLVSRLGEGGFLGLYSAISFITLGWLFFAYRAAPPTPLLWAVGNGLWLTVTLVMLIAMILFMGSLIRNPALPNGGRPMTLPTAPSGVFAVTRHPMLWAFALWGLCHIAVFPMGKNIIVAATMAFLSLVGAALQDAKKRSLQPEVWRAWEQRTSYWPFAAIASGRARFGGFGMHALGGGVVLWLLVTWAHIPLAGWPAGIWRWI